MSIRPVAPLPRLALRRDEAAACLGMSLDSFERHVQPFIRMLRRGKLRLVPVSELQRFLDQNSEGVWIGDEKDQQDRAN